MEMTVQARINFYDIENNRKLRTKGEKFEVTEERGKYLIMMRVAKEVTDTKSQSEK